jgi:hypothetical protein
VLLKREQVSARRVQQQHALQQVEGADDEQVVLAFATTRHQAVEGVEQAVGDVPLETLLQLEEFEEGRVVGQVGERLGLGRVGARAAQGGRR